MLIFDCCWCSSYSRSENKITIYVSITLEPLASFRYCGFELTNSFGELARLSSLLHYKHLRAKHWRPILGKPNDVTANKVLIWIWA